MDKFKIDYLVERLQKREQVEGFDEDDVMAEAAECIISLAQALEEAAERNITLEAVLSKVITPLQVGAIAINEVVAVIEDHLNKKHPVSSQYWKQSGAGVEVGTFLSSLKNLILVLRKQNIIYDDIDEDCVIVHKDDIFGETVSFITNSLHPGVIAIIVDEECNRVNTICRLVEMIFDVEVRQ